jgi:hypothetical protein
MAMPWAVDLHVDDMLGVPRGCLGMGMGSGSICAIVHSNNDIRLEAHNISFDDNSTFAEASRVTVAACTSSLLAAVTK